MEEDDSADRNTKSITNPTAGKWVEEEDGAHVAAMREWLASQPEAERSQQLGERLYRCLAEIPELSLELQAKVGRRGGVGA